MKFDFIIGNPPYQESYEGESTGANSIYDKFMVSTYQLADRVELITPARFLFNAGSTPKEWNEKMLSDPHVKVLEYAKDATYFFRNVEIKGGVAITYRDANKDFGAIGIFTPFNDLNSIVRKIKSNSSFVSISKITVTSFAYHFTEQMHSDYPEAREMMSRGHAYDLKSSSFERLPQIFLEEKPNDGKDYIRILGRENNERVYKYIQRAYVNSVVNLDKYKVFIPKANGNGDFGEVLTSPVIGDPGVGATETFLSIGAFDDVICAENVLKYIKCKFTRAMLNVLKVTQDVTPAKWGFVPIQDFSANSDIDWSRTISEIDMQLYKKYGLNNKEIDFIESHVKEME